MEWGEKKRKRGEKRGKEERRQGLPGEFWECQSRSLTVAKLGEPALCQRPCQARGLSRRRVLLLGSLGRLCGGATSPASWRGREAGEGRPGLPKPQRKDP